MSGAINLSDTIEKYLPAELGGFMRLAGEAAAGRKQGFYLVGGVVRDLLLGQTNLDLDLVVEGDAIALGQALAQARQAKITAHPRFNTAKLQWDGWSVDIATARSESYARPGALPDVKPGRIQEDLSRRDFTINAMAVYLSPGRYGELIDLYGGRADLERKLVRVLHDRSFIDDATRIWRGLRYEQRLDFQLEENTLRLLQRDVSMLDTISGDRIRNELELVLKEKLPEKVLRRAEELGVLQRLHPSLKGNRWLSEKLAQARHLSHTSPPSIGIYLALLTYRLSGQELECLISYLRLPKSLSQVLRDTISLKDTLQALADPELKPSQVYQMLHGCSLPAITVNLLACEASTASQHIHLFLDKLRYVKPALTGDSLILMGVAPGPGVKQVLDLLRQARLNGEATAKRDEQAMVSDWLARNRIKVPADKSNVERRHEP